MPTARNPANEAPGPALSPLVGESWRGGLPGSERPVTSASNPILPE